MATNQDKIATIGDIKTLLATAKKKGVTIKKSDGTEWAVPSSFTDNSLCPTYNQINGTVLPSYADNASDKLSSTDGVVIGNFKGSATAYTDTQLVRLGDITLKATTLDSSSFSLTTNSKVETSCAVSATCEYTYDVNVSSYSYEDTDVSTSTSTVTGTSGTWSGTDSSTSNVLSNKGQNMSFTNTREYTISCSVTMKGETMSDSLTLTQPKREQGKFISSSSTEDSHALEAEVDKTSFDCNGGKANVTWYHVYGSATSTTYEDTCGVQYTETSGEGRKRDNIGTEAYTIPNITCDPMTGYTTTSHTLTSSYTYTDSEGNSQTVDGSVDVSQKCWSCEMAYKYTLVDGTVFTGVCTSTSLSRISIMGDTYDTAKKIELFDCIKDFQEDTQYFNGAEIETIEMTDSVTALTKYFAAGAPKLKHITLSSSLNTIPQGAFGYCDSLTEIGFIPEGVEKIDNWAFQYCSNVASATIPSTVKTMAAGVFRDDRKLKDIYMLPSTPPTITTSTFVSLPTNYIIHVPCDYEEDYKTASDNWRAIASHVVGDCPCNPCYTISTSELSDSAATSNTLVCTCQVTSSQSICSSLKSYVPDISAITVDGNWLTVSRTNATLARDGFRVYATYSENTSEEERNCKLTIPLVSSNSELTCGNETLEVNIIQKGHVTEGSHALEAEIDKTSFDCNGGTANVTWYHVYGEGRKRDNIGTEEYNIPSIACDPMTGSTTTSHTLTSSYTYTDSEGNSQTVDGSVDVSQKCESCEMAYKYTMRDGTIKSGTCRSTLLSFNSIKGYYNKAQKIELFNCINGFASDNSYFGGDEITSITMTDSVSAITSSFATGAKKLTTVRLSSQLKSIPSWAFRECDSLTNINFIPQGVETIGENAFGWCQNVTSATIPSSVTSIGNHAFTSCVKLQDIYMSSSTPPTISDTSFNLLANNYIIHVPCDYEEDYKTASDNWVAIASHVVGDCSCNSCFEVITNNLPSTGNTTSFTCATVTVTGTNSICSEYTSSSTMPSTIYVSDNYSSWITSAWTSIIYSGSVFDAPQGVAVKIHCTQNDTSETRYATLILSGDSCTEGIEINLIQEAAITENCSIVGGYHHTCSTLPSGTLLSYCSITSDTESCSSITFESTDFEMKYESPYIKVEYLQIADNGKTIQVYGSMEPNLSSDKVGALLSVSATASNGIKKYDIPIEQEPCSECWDCFQLDNPSMSSYAYIGDDGKTIYANASGSTSQSDTLIGLKKKSEGICSDYAMYTNLELVDNGYGTDWIRILHFNEAGGNYIVTSGGMSPNNTNNLRTCTFRYTASAGTSCPIDILVIQPSSPNSCYHLYSSDIPYLANTNDIVADIVKTGTTSVCDTMPSFFDKATVIKGSSWITRATTQDKGNNDTGLYLSYTENTTQSRRYGVVRLSSSTNPQAFFDCELYQQAAPIEAFQITGATVIKLCTEERKIYYTIDYVGTAPSTATCKVSSIEQCANQFGVTDTDVSVNRSVHTISIHGGVSSACTNQQLIVEPNEGVNASATSYAVNFHSAWTECSGTISLKEATASPITSGSATEALLTLNLEYSGPTDIDTNGLTINFNYYLNITVAHSDGSMACPTCSATYLDKPLCNFVMTLKGLQLKSLINNGSLSYSELMTVADVPPSTCSYSFGTQHYVSASSSDTTKIKIGNGFSAPPLG